MLSVVIKDDDNKQRILQSLNNYDNK